MFKKYIAYYKNNGIVPYIWMILCILPFYFIFQATSTVKIIIGIVMTVIFLVIYRIALSAKGWSVYIWASILIAISVTATSLFNYVYFAFFLAYYIGNIKQKGAFFTFYFINLIASSIAINFNLVQQEPLFMKQLPFVIIVWISIILMPLTIRSRKVKEQLEMKLEDANKKIAELILIEERDRISRDLHDTLGQKLSLIGLKADLARRVMNSNPDAARNELKDVQQTARTALNEVRKLVSSMRSIRLKDEIVRVSEMLEVAQIQFDGVQLPKLKNITLLTENILSMCLKEAVTNIVKHSGATECSITIEQSQQEIQMRIRDNGHFKDYETCFDRGHGLVGMKERLEFVNGSLDIEIDNGTVFIIKVPNDVKQTDREEDQ